MKNIEPMDAEHWAELYRLREAVKGPEGFATWQDAAVHERMLRVKSESSPLLPQQGGEQTDWKHVANEWADVACNALDGLRNIRDDGLVEIDINSAIQNIEDGIKRAREVSAAVLPQVGEATDYKDAFKLACADMNAVVVLLGLDGDKYTGVDAVLRAITDLITAAPAGLGEANEPSHPQFVAGFKAGHKAGRARGLGEAKAVAPDELHVILRPFVDAANSYKDAASGERVLQGNITLEQCRAVRTILTAIAITHPMPVARVEKDGFEIAWLNRSPMPVSTELFAAPVAQALPVAEKDYADLYRWLREDRLVNEPISYPTFPWVVRCELAPWPTSMRLTGTDLDSAIRSAMQGEKA